MYTHKALYQVSVSTRNNGDQLCDGVSVTPAGFPVVLHIADDLHSSVNQQRKKYKFITIVWPQTTLSWY